MVTRRGCPFNRTASCRAPSAGPAVAAYRLALNLPEWCAVPAASLMAASDHGRGDPSRHTGQRITEEKAVAARGFRLSCPTRSVTAGLYDILELGTGLSKKKISKGKRIMPVSVEDRQFSYNFQGLYSLPEAARYLKAADHAGSGYSVSSRKLSHWVRRQKASGGLASIHASKLLIDFEELISFRVILTLRAAGVTWKEIEATEAWWRNESGKQRPFATELLWAGQGELFAEWQGLLSASRHGQLALEWLRESPIPLHGLAFSQETHTATSWEPLRGVVLDPLIQCGASCIKGRRIPTRSIAGMVEAGDSIGFLKEAYGLAQTEIQAALEWEARLAV